MQGWNNMDPITADLWPSRWFSTRRIHVSFPPCTVFDAHFFRPPSEPNATWPRISFGWCDRRHSCFSTDHANQHIIKADDASRKAGVFTVTWYKACSQAGLAEKLAAVRWNDHKMTKPIAKLPSPPHRTGANWRDHAFFRGQSSTPRARINWSDLLFVVVAHSTVSSDLRAVAVTPGRVGW